MASISAVDPNNPPNLIPYAAQPLAGGTGLINGSTRGNNGRVNWIIAPFHEGTRSSAAAQIIAPTLTAQHPATATGVSTQWTVVDRVGAIGVVQGTVCLLGKNGFGSVARIDDEDTCRPVGLWYEDTAHTHDRAQPNISDRAAYTADQGSYLLRLFETAHLGTGVVIDWTDYIGEDLYCSLNGLITPLTDAANAFEAANGGRVPTVIGRLLDADASKGLILLQQTI
jgi:hypothetical protein